MSYSHNVRVTGAPVWMPDCAVRAARMWPKRSGAPFRVAEEQSGLTDGFADECPILRHHLSTSGRPDARGPDAPSDVRRRLVGAIQNHIMCHGIMLLRIMMVVSEQIHSNTDLTTRHSCLLQPRASTLPPRTRSPVVPQQPNAVVQLARLDIKRPVKGRGRRPPGG